MQGLGRKELGHRGRIMMGLPLYSKHSLLFSESARNIPSPQRTLPVVQAATAVFHKQLILMQTLSSFNTPRWTPLFFPVCRQEEHKDNVLSPAQLILFFFLSWGLAENMPLVIYPKCR